MYLVAQASRLRKKSLVGTAHAFFTGGIMAPPRRRHGLLIFSRTFTILDTHCTRETFP